MVELFHCAVYALEMNFKYVLSPKTHGANPFKIFDSLSGMDQEALRNSILAMPYKEFMGTAYWFAVSMVCKSRAGMRCQVCNSGAGIQTHHRTYDTHGAEHRNMMDLVVLCARCHGVFHGGITVEYQAPKPSQPIVIYEPMRERRERKVKRRKGYVIPHTEADLVMPDGEIITLTRELIYRCQTDNGGITNATIRALGVPVPLLAGWPIRLEGKQLTRAQYREALEGRFIYNSGSLKTGS